MDTQGNTAITEFFVLKTSLGHNTINRDTVKQSLITNIICALNVYANKLNMLEIGKFKDNYYCEDYLLILTLKP